MRSAFQIFLKEVILEEDVRYQVSRGVSGGLHNKTIGIEWES